ncbi:MAG: hypothetical protein ABIQ70_01790, partial [Dokdonella sp.]
RLSVAMTHTTSASADDHRDVRRFHNSVAVIVRVRKGVFLQPQQPSFVLDPSLHPDYGRRLFLLSVDFVTERLSSG